MEDTRSSSNRREGAGGRAHQRRGGCSHRARRWDRKERVLHTRVSESLADDIRRIAEDLRVPASNLVRNVLEEVFDVVESVSDDMGELFEEVLDEAQAARERIARARSGRRRRRRSPRDVEDLRDRDAWEAARAEVAETERAAEGRGAPPPPPLEWYIVEAGRRVGPLGRDELVAAARAGRLRGDTLVWAAGMADWTPARRLAALGGLFEPPPVPAEESPEEAPTKPSGEA